MKERELSRFFFFFFFENVIRAASRDSLLIHVLQAGMRIKKMLNFGGVGIMKYFIRVVWRPFAKSANLIVTTRIGARFIIIIIIIIFFFFTETAFNKFEGQKCKANLRGKYPDPYINWPAKKSSTRNNFYPL